MGIFDIFKKSVISFPNKPRTLVAMPMFNDGESYSLPGMLDELTSTWGLDVSDIEGDDHSAVFKADGVLVAMALIPMQIPWSDIESVAAHTYNWPAAAEDLKAHNAHVIVSIMGSEGSTLRRSIILTKVLAAMLSTSGALGVYQGAQTLLISKAQYLPPAEALKEGNMPFVLWIYFGIIQSPEGNSVYTYGLNVFDKQEMEILNSPLDMEDVYRFMLNICAYVLRKDITLKDGETLGYTENQKVKIRSSEGVFVAGQTLKLMI